MVEMTLEVRPKDGTPFQVKRKFVANRAIEVGKRAKVLYNPADPQKVDLV